MLKKWQCIAIGAGLAGLFGLFASCGSKDDKDSGNDKTGTTLSFATDVDPILTASCGGSDCHSSTSAYTHYIGSEDTFKARKKDVIERLGLASTNALVMPKTPDAAGKTRTISSDDKTKLINFLNQ